MADFLDLEARVDGEDTSSLSDSDVICNSESDEGLNSDESELSEVIPLPSKQAMKRKLRLLGEDNNEFIPKKNRRNKSNAKNSSKSLTPIASKKSTPKRNAMSTQSSNSKTPENRYDELLKEQKKSNRLLAALITTTESQDDCLKVVEETVKKIITTPKRKKSATGVPSEVRVRFVQAIVIV